MKPRDVKVGLILALCAATITSVAQAEREDVIWARVTTSPIVLDGVLNEPSWAAAETKVMTYATDSGIPGSGWKSEGGVTPSDPTQATLRFLVFGNQLYVAAEVPDKSIGGAGVFNRFDGLLMALKDHTSTGAPKPPAEYFYAWWAPQAGGYPPDPQPAGQGPVFHGRWANPFGELPRTAEQIAAWDAVTVMNGLSNDDSVDDVGYTIEMRFDLTPMGYDVTRPEGDIIEFNVSVYDCDWFWPIDAGRFSSNRVWWQGPWGNQMWYNEVRVYAKPSVTTVGSVPGLAPEVFILHSDDPAPTVDGDLSDAAWSNPDVYTFDIRYDDADLRSTYPSVGPYRSGQFQPEVYDTTATVFDPGDATIKMFHQDSTLYIGFDVRDSYVQYHPNFDRWDGFLVFLNDREIRGGDNQLWGRRLGFQVDADGSALPRDFLATLVAEGGAEVAISLNAGTVVDTLGGADTGYTAELAVKLTRLGYPTDLGDRALFLAVDMLDGDSFFPAELSYGTRTWWFREYEGVCCPSWAYLAPPDFVGIDPQVGVGHAYVQTIARPNPSPRPRIHYVLPEANHVTLEIYDVAGRRVREQVLGIQPAGLREIGFDGSLTADGVYFYRLRLADPATGEIRATPTGKVSVLR